MKRCGTEVRRWQEKNYTHPGGCYMYVKQTTLSLVILDVWQAKEL
jgi:hypothetical protein